MTNYSYTPDSGSAAKSDLVIPIYDDRDSSAQSSYTLQSSHAYFWEKPKVYANEHRICSVVPTMRFVNTLLVMYAIWTGIDFIVSLCTLGMEFVCSVALIFSMTYWIWATW